MARWHTPRHARKIVVIKMSQANCFDYNTHSLSPSRGRTPKSKAEADRQAGPRDMLNKLQVSEVSGASYMSLSLLFTSYCLSPYEDPSCLIVKVTRPAAPWCNYHTMVRPTWHVISRTTSCVKFHIIQLLGINMFSGNTYRINLHVVEPLLISLFCLYAALALCVSF